MCKEQPNYYAILPAEVRYNPNLTGNEKLLYAEITALTYVKGECWASNGYFARLYCVSKQTISNYIRHLRDEGLICVVVERNEQKQVTKRIITVSKAFNIPSQKTDIYPIVENLEENTTSENITSKNKKKERKKKDEILVAIPESLASIEGFEDEYKAHLRARKTVATDRAQELEMNILAKRPNDALELLRESILRGWVGLKWEWFDNTNTKNNTAPSGNPFLGA